MGGRGCRSQRNGAFALVAPRRRFEILQQRAAVVQSSRVGPDRKRTVKSVERFLEASENDQDIGAVAVGVGEIRLERDGAVVARKRFLRLAEPEMRFALQVVQARLRRTERKRALDQLYAVGVLTLLHGDDGDIIEGVGVVRVSVQYLHVALHGGAQIAHAVECERALKELT